MLKIRGFEPVNTRFLKSYDTMEEVVLPQCKTKNSSGYDFVAPFSFMLGVGEKIVIWSDVSAYMLDDEELLMFIRSKVGIKLDVILCNAVGKIDSDYFDNKDTDGNIGIALRNTGDVLRKFDKGEGLAQGTFYKFLRSDNGNSNDIREGGMGSTDG